MTVPREDFDLAPIDMRLKPVAIVFDFVNPYLTRRSLGLQGGELGFNEPRHLGFATHNATDKNASPTATGGEAEDEARLIPREGMIANKFDVSKFLRPLHPPRINNRKERGDKA